MGDRTELYYDPYRADIAADPYPLCRPLRDEAPLYYNEPHDFFAVGTVRFLARRLAR